jgi:hypothetical protein
MKTRLITRSFVFSGLIVVAFAFLPDAVFATLTANNAKQYRADTGAIIPDPSGTIPTGVGVYFDCAATDTTGATIQMQVELQQLPATWTGTPNYSSSYVASGGRPRTTTATGLTAGNYGWRFRVVNSSGTTGIWVAANNPDFIVQGTNQVTLTLYVHSGSASGPLLSGALVTGSDGAGKSFNQTTGSAGYVTITGASGTWQFTASGTGYSTTSWNESITSTETLNAFLTANPAPTMALSNPNAGTTWQVGTSQTVGWSVSGDTSQISYFVVRLSTDNGVSYTDISANLSASTRSFNYTPTSGQATTIAVCWVRAFNSSGTALAGATSSGAFTIAASCPYSLSSSTANPGSGSGSSSFTVTTGGSCTWSAVSDSTSWLHTSSSGTGSGTVSYAYDATTSTSSRTGHIMVGGQTFAVTQEGQTTSYILGGDFNTGGGTVSWSQENSGGRTFAFIKATQDNINNNPLPSNMAAQPAGFPVGMFDYADPQDYFNASTGTFVITSPNDSSAVTTDAQAEADFFYQTAKPYLTAGNLLPAIDLEDNQGNGGFDSTWTSSPAGWSAMANWVNSWTAEFQTHMPGVYPILYMTQFYAGNLAPLLDQNKYKLWIAIAGGTTQYNQPVVPPSGDSYWNPTLWPWAIEQYQTTSTVYPPDLDVLNPSITLSSLEIGPANTAILTATASPTSGGAATGSGTFPVGSSQPITAVANAGWTFTGWSDGNTQPSRSVTIVAGANTYTASFTTQTATLTVTANNPSGGSATGSGTFPVGSSQPITAVANAGWTFTGWSDGNTQPSRSVTIVAGANTYTASFTTQTATLTVTANNPSGGSATGSGTFPVGSSQTIIAIANANWTFTGWNDGSSLGLRMVTITNGANSYVADFTYVGGQPFSLQPGQFSSGTGFTFSFEGGLNQNYLVQWSSDLANWQTLTNVSGTIAPIVINDGTTTATLRFYRVIEN